MSSQSDYVTHISEPKKPENLKYTPHEVTYFVGGLKYPLRTYTRNTIVLGHRPKGFEPATGPVRKLTVIHVGSEEPPDVSMYAQTCTSVDFLGHVGSANAVFAIVEQLQTLKKVSISLGPFQLLYDESYSHRKPFVCPSVTSLRINIDRAFYNNLQHQHCDQSEPLAASCVAGECFNIHQTSFVELARALLNHAVGSFPNLKDFEVLVPDNFGLYFPIQWLVHHCPNLKLKVSLAEAHQVPNGAEGYQAIDDGDDDFQQFNQPQQNRPPPGFSMLPRFISEVYVCSENGLCLGCRSIAVQCN